MASTRRLNKVAVTVGLVLCSFLMASCGSGLHSTASSDERSSPTRTQLFQPRFAYVASQNGGISGYAVDPTTGALKQVPGSPFAAATNSTAITVDPAGRFVYVADSYLNAIQAYTIDQNTGALSKQFAVYPAGNQPGALAAHPSGKWLYAANRFSGNVSAYQINGASGTLTEVAGSPFAVGGWCFALAIDSGGRFAYVADYQGNRLLAFSIDQNTGALAPLGSVPVATNPDSIAVNPNGRVLYIGTIGSTVESIAAFNIDPNSGMLSAGPILYFPYGVGTFSLAFDPSGRWLYSANGIKGNTSLYKPDSAGTLSMVQNAGYPGEHAPNQVIVDPSGHFVYLADLSGGVMAFAINESTGALTPVPGSPFPAGNSPVGIAVTH